MCNSWRPDAGLSLHHLFRLHPLTMKAVSTITTTITIITFSSSSSRRLLVM
jgi:hypothetical protein